MDRLDEVITVSVLAPKALLHTFKMYTKIITLIVPIGMRTVCVSPHSHFLFSVAEVG